MKALLDTNIIVDALQSRAPWAGDAQAIFRAVANEQFIGCITAKAASDIHYLTRRCTHSEVAARNTLNKLFTLFELLDTTAMDCKRALVSETSDYEDAIMIESALREGVDCIVTRNMRNYRRLAVPVLAPEAFLKRLVEDQHS